MTIIIFQRKRKSSSYSRLSNEEIEFIVSVTDSTEIVSTETDSTETDSTTSEPLLADKYEGKWDFSDEEIAEDFPKAPLDPFYLDEIEYSPDFNPNYLPNLQK